MPEQLERLVDFQVLSFLTEKRLEQGEVAKTLWNSSSGSARVVRLERAPAAFHAQFSGEWRSYLYLLPLHMAEGAEFPEDTEEARELEAPVESIMSMIGGLEGCTLDMNAFARDTPKGKNTEVWFSSLNLLIWGVGGQMKERTRGAKPGGDEEGQGGPSEASRQGGRVPGSRDGCE